MLFVCFFTPDLRFDSLDSIQAREEEELRGE